MSAILFSSQVFEFNSKTQRLKGSKTTDDKNRGKTSEAAKTGLRKNVAVL